LDSNIINLLQENEIYFCKHWSRNAIEAKDKFFALYNKDLDNDYFLNRVVINKSLYPSLDNPAEIESLIVDITHLSKTKKITLYLHINSDYTTLEEHLIKKNFEKIDEVLGLQYPLFFDDNNGTLYPEPFEKQSNCFRKIILADNCNDLRQWIKAYCNIFEIGIENEGIIFDILKNKAGAFHFVLFKDTCKDTNPWNVMGCGIIFPYKNSIALYCLGTKKEYRHNKIATNIINYSINYGRRKKYLVLGLQTLLSNRLLSFYEKQGFEKIYNNKIYRINNS